MINKVAVVGAGTMGSGIAFSFAQNGIPSVLFDINEAVIQKARSSVEANLEFLLSKNKIDAAEKQNIQNRISFTNEIRDCKADLVIEAVVENMGVKKNLFRQLAEINTRESILASNTSSLSISEIQHGLDNPDRIAGIHFFNPAHVMKLVEVIKGEQTSDEVITLLADLCRRIGKVPVLCKDAPGFIVNRVARHFYLESMHLYENNIAGFEDIDKALEDSGFKMGPFRLMDLIGMDVNLAVSTSIYDAFNHAPRFRPSRVQINKVEKQELGRKTGKGFY